MASRLPRETNLRLDKRAWLRSIPQDPATANRRGRLVGNLDEGRTRFGYAARENAERLLDELFSFLGGLDADVSRILQSADDIEDLLLHRLDLRQPVTKMNDLVHVRLTQ